MVKVPATSSIAPPSLLYPFIIVRFSRVMVGPSVVYTIGIGGTVSITSTSVSYVKCKK